MLEGSADSNAHLEVTKTLPVPVKEDGCLDTHGASLSTAAIGFLRHYIVSWHNEFDSS